MDAISPWKQKEEDSVNKSKKLTAAVAASAVASAVVAPAAFAATNLTDINDSYAKDAILSLVEAGILSGTGNGSFNPTGKIARQDFAIILAKSLNLKVEAPATATFSDVPKDHYAFGYVEAAAKAGLIAGLGGGKFGTGENLSRQDMAALFVRALKYSTGYDATGKGAAVAKFSDAASIADYAKDAVGAAVELGLISGNPDGTFNPAGVAERQAVALVASKFIKAVEAQATKVVKAEVVDSKTLTLTFSKEVAELKKEDVAVAVKASGAAVAVSEVTLSADKKSATVKLGADLAAATTFTVKVKGNSVEFTTVAKLEVASVEALNLREVEVKFNAPVNGTEAAKAANYFVNGNNVAKVKVSDDKKSVTLLLATNQALGNYSTTNEVKVLKAVGFDADITVKNVAAKDTVVPTATSVEATGPRTLKVTFSEPIAHDINPATEAAFEAAVVAAFSLNDGTVAINSDISVDGRTVVLTTLADLAEGDNTLKLAAATAVADNAGYKASPATLTFNYKKDTSIPTATVAESNEKSVTIKFSKAIDAATLTGNTNVRFTHTYNTATNQVDNTKVVNTGDNQTFVINFDAPLPPGATTVYFKYADADGAKVTDNYGNVFASTTFTVNTTADVTKPEVSSVAFVNKNTVDVTFSEGVIEADAETTSNYVLKDAAGDKVAVTSAVYDVNKKMVTLSTLPADINGGNYTLEVKGIKDLSIAGNTLDTVTKTFVATDKVPPTVKDKDAVAAGNQVKKISDKKLKIEFSEIMDVASITDKSVYKIAGATFSSFANATIEATDSNKAVILTFAQASEIPDNAAIQVSRVKDAAGNWSEAFVTDATAVAVTNVATTAVEVTGKNTVVLTFDEAVTGATTADFRISLDAGATWVSPVAIATSIKEGKTYVTLTTAAANAVANSDVPANTVMVKTVNIGGTDGASGRAKNVYGTPVELLATTAATDKFAPIFEGAAMADSDADTFVDHVALTFSEELYAYSVQESDFTVEGYQVTAVSYAVVGGKGVVTLTVKEKDANDLSAKPKVTVVGDVEDTDRNVAKGSASNSKTATSVNP